MSFKVPTEIVDSIKRGQCILFLGAMASAALPPETEKRFVYTSAPPGGTELSLKLARRFNYPYSDSSNLQRVSLFVETQPNQRRSGLINAIFGEITKPEITPSPALKMLAELPFRFIITTNYDQLFELALRSAKSTSGSLKSPIIRVYDPSLTGKPEPVPLDPSEDRPVFLKLHGDIDRPDSIVITEEDYITFIYRMGSTHFHPIHEKIRSRMMEWPVLFVGYSLKDYNLRLLFRTLRWNIDGASYPLSVAVDPYPDDLIVAVYQDGAEPILSFIKQDLWHFVPALYEACLGHPFHQ
jgi:hypothetical protein